MINKFFTPKIVPFMRYVEKHCTAGQATDDNMAHAHCMLDTKVYKYTRRICNIPYLLLFYCNDGCTKVPQCYVKPTLLVLLVLFYIPVLI